MPTTWSRRILILTVLCVLLALLWSNNNGNGNNIVLLPSQQHHDDESLLRSSCWEANTNLYDRPVIGILSHPGDGASGRLNNATNASYIAASYVKLAESGGARVIPLIYNEPPEKLLKVHQYQYIIRCCVIYMNLRLIY